MDATTRHTSEPLCSKIAPAHCVVVVAFASPSIEPAPAGAIVSVFVSLETFFTATSAPAIGALGSVTVKPAVAVLPSTKSPAAAVKFAVLVRTLDGSPLPLPPPPAESAGDVN